MNLHQNAKTTPKMRALIVSRRQAGEKPRRIASAIGVSVATVAKWLARHAAAMVWRRQARVMQAGADGLLRDKTPPPGKAPVADALVAQVVAMTLKPPPPEARTGRRARWPRLRATGSSQPARDAARVAGADRR